MLIFILIYIIFLSFRRAKIVLSAWHGFYLFHHSRFRFAVYRNAFWHIYFLLNVINDKCTSSSYIQLHAFEVDTKRFPLQCSHSKCTSAINCISTVISPSPWQCSHLPPSTLKEKNPLL